jgi:D-glycero-D-manno-heptose 1,7-bisphosphate phosphatase
MTGRDAFHRVCDILMKPRPAVFVDRDGTLNEMVYDETHGLLDSPRRAEQVRLKPGAARFLQRLRHAGYFLCVVTNQPGVAKGTLSPDDLAAVNGRLAGLLAAEDAAWDDIRVCPHHPGGPAVPAGELVRTCACRKPSPGMLLDAARQHGLDLAASWMVGDGLNDIQAGHAAGCRAILVGRLKLEQIERFLSLEKAEPDIVVPDLAAAADRILASAPCR